LRSARTAALFECVSGLGERCPIEATRFDRIKHGASELSALRRSNWLRSGFRSSDWPAGLNHRRRRLLIFGALDVAIIEHADQRQNALSARAYAAALFCQSRIGPAQTTCEKHRIDGQKEARVLHPVLLPGPGFSLNLTFIVTIRNRVMVR
jgi:hypothetical protein